MPNLLTVDPGGTTGWAAGSYGLDEPYEVESTWLSKNGVDGVSEVYFSSAPATTFDRKFNTTVVEGWTKIAGGPPPDLSAVEAIGFMKGVQWHNMILQPRERKHNVPDHILRDNNLWHPGKTGRHMNDAIIHAIYYLAFVKRHGPTIAKYFPEPSG